MTTQRTYSLRPAWLTDSLKTLETFQETSQAVKKEFDHLSAAFTQFAAAAEASSQVDQRHQENMANGFTTSTRTPEQRRREIEAKSQRHPLVRLPSEIHGNLILFLDLFGVDSVLCCSKIMRRTLTCHSEVWKPWATQRWVITQAEGNRDSWLMACDVRASVLRPIVQLIEKYRHRDAGSYRIAGMGSLEEWSELLCGLVYLTSSPGDWTSRRSVSVIFEFIHTCALCVFFVFLFF